MHGEHFPTSLMSPVNRGPKPTSKALTWCNTSNSLPLSVHMPRVVMRARHVKPPAAPAPTPPPPTALYAAAAAPPLGRMRSTATTTTPSKAKVSRSGIAISVAVPVPLPSKETLQQQGQNNNGQRRDSSIKLSNAHGKCCHCCRACMTRASPLHITRTPFKSSRITIQPHIPEEVWRYQ